MAMTEDMLYVESYYILSCPKYSLLQGLKLVFVNLLQMNCFSYGAVCQLCKVTVY